MTAYAASLAGSGALTAGIDVVIQPELRLVASDNVIVRGPSSITVILTEGAPSTDVTFDIDGTVVMTIPTDTQGELVGLSLPVDTALATVGSHTITATQAGSASASTTFTVQYPTWASLRAVLPDVGPVGIPGAVMHGTQHWVLQDPTPGGLGSWVMPINPSSWKPPHVQRSLDAIHTTAQTGQFHVTESGDDPVEFTFTGYCPDKAMHDQLVAWGELKRRFYLIDHRNRAWKVAFANVALTARRRQRNLDGTVTDWAHDYTVTALCYDQKWTAPA